MTREDLLKMLFPELLIEHIVGCQHINTSCVANCNDCQFNNYWEQEVVIPKTTAKCILNSAYGTSYYLDTDSTHKVEDAFKNGSTHAVFPMNKPIDEWIEVPSAILTGDLSCTISEILDDATVHGLDFKYENGKYYYKERQDVHN